MSKKRPFSQRIAEACGMIYDEVLVCDDSLFWCMKKKKDDYTAERWVLEGLIKLGAIKRLLLKECPRAIQIIQEDQVRKTQYWRSRVYLVLNLRLVKEWQVHPPRIKQAHWRQYVKKMQDSKRSPRVSGLVAAVGA